MRIAFLGNFGTRNFGNDASLEAMIEALRATAPTAELSCICPNPSGIRERFGIATIGLTVDSPQGRAMRALERLSFGYSRRIGNLFAAFLRVRGQDVLIVPGTGLLDDYRDRPRGWPFMLLRWCLAARLNGVRIAFVNIGAGPILHPLSRRLMKTAAQMCCYRSYRDAPSREFMRTLGVDVSDDQVFPDLAFHLSGQPDRSKHEDGASLTVGLGVMTYFGWVAGDAVRDAEIYSSYLDRLADLTETLVRKGYRVRLLMGDASDAQVIEDLRRKLSSAQLEDISAAAISEPATEIHDVIRQIADCDVVIATRYHNVVAALLQRRPTISLEYAEKNAAVLRTFGLGEYCHHIESFLVDEVLADLDRLIKNKATYQELIGTRLAEAKTALDQQSRRFVERVLKLPLQDKPAFPARSAPQRARAGSS